MGLFVYGILVHLSYFSSDSYLLPSSWIFFGKRFSMIRRKRWRLSQILFYNFILGPLLIVFRITGDENHSCTGYFSFFYTYICGERQTCYLEMYNLLLQQLWFACIPTLCLDIYRCYLKHVGDQTSKNSGSCNGNKPERGKSLSAIFSYYFRFFRTHMTSIQLLQILITLYQVGIFLRYCGCYGFLTFMCSPALSLVFFYCCL